MFAISLATPYIIEPLLDTMGIRGCLLCGFWVSHIILSGSRSGVRFFVSVLGDLSVGFAVLSKLMS